jgi:glucose/arabinose dehydrogenase
VPLKAGRALAALALPILAACAEQATLPDAAGYGAEPTLVPARAQWLPTVHVARVVGWSADQTPTPGSELRVVRYAEGLDHPRWLLPLPNGDVLVAETNAPAPEPGTRRSITDWAMGIVKKVAGAATPSADRITLLRASAQPGAAAQKFVFLSGLHSPFGMALVGDWLYVANTDAVLRFRYETGATHITSAGTKVLALPAGPINHHWTKNLLASPDGHFLYVTVGSNSNAAENGLANEVGRAAIWRVDLATGEASAFATGLRNPNGMDWEPGSGVLWTVVNERDALGSDLVPDYMTAVRTGAFYGWPFSYYGHHVDERVRPANAELVAQAVVPDYALGAHTASLGLAFSRGDALPSAYRHGVFIGQHGSWNRRPFSGYQVIFVPFARGTPSGGPQLVLAGFLDPHGRARGRPVGVAISADGALLVADDVGNCVWRVTARAATSPPVAAQERGATADASLRAGD